MLKKFKSIFFSAILIISVIAITLSLISYNSNDHCLIFYSSTNNSINNYLSSFGANFAGILLYLFGFTSWLLIILLILILIKLLNQKNLFSKSQYINLSAFLLTIPLLCSIFYKYKIEIFKQISPGGVLGRKIYLNLLYLFGPQLTPILLFMISWAILSVFLVDFMLKLVGKIKLKKYIIENSFDNNINLENGHENIKPENIINSSYKLPEAILFNNAPNNNQEQQDSDSNKELINILEKKLLQFSIQGKVVEIINGPVVKLIKYQPNIQVKVSQILSLEDDLALALQALSLRIIAPMPGQPYVGFEIANSKKKTVYFSQLINNLNKSKGLLPVILGKNSSGQETIIDLAKMPHLLIAGSTGSGKSSGLNSIIMSLIYNNSPEQVKLILIDPKRLEFTNYQDIAHLIFPIINTPINAIKALKWVVGEMESRYNNMSKFKVKNIEEFNKLDFIKINLDTSENKIEKLAFIVVIIDELADLMITAGKEVEMLITRIAQLSRACGIHLVIATQRPSVDVITGTIKINFPSRIAFRVASKTDSRTILDANGAEKLLGAGDMLFLNSEGALQRVHGAYVDSSEINSLTEYIKSQQEPHYQSLESVINRSELNQNSDELIDEILEFIKTKEEISISLLQRAFKIGFNRSAGIIEYLESHGYITASNGKKIRKVVKLDKC